MPRTRKRDDDSAQYNSDTTSLAALDASSMSATGSRSTFASSTKALNGNHNKRPNKRRRKSLTDALQSISLDKDKGVPQQILSSSKMGDFPFSNSNSTKSVAFTMIGSSGNTCSSGKTVVFGSASSVDNYSNKLNFKQQVNRHIDRESSAANGDGDIYYDDDNSQLTSSTDDHDRDQGMEEDFDDDEGDEDSERRKLALMTDFEKAQRKIMLGLVFGTKNRDSVNTKTIAGAIASFSDPIREVSSCFRLPSELIVDPIQGSSSMPSTFSPPPFATISTSIAPMTGKAAVVAPIAKRATASSEDHDDNEHDYKDPADRKIEELLRRSLENLQKGSHPLRLPNTDINEDCDLGTTTPWLTQDDMAIDPKIYSPRVQRQMPSTTETSHSMALDTKSGANPTRTIHAQGSTALPTQAQRRPFVRQRSNSLPDGLDMMETVGTMDTDV